MRVGLANIKARGIARALVKFSLDDGRCLALVVVCQPERAPSLLGETGLLKGAVLPAGPSLRPRTRRRRSRSTPCRRGWPTWCWVLGASWGRPCWCGWRRTLGLVRGGWLAGSETVCSLLVVLEARPECNGGRGGLFWSTYGASAGGTSRLVGDGAVHLVARECSFFADSAVDRGEVVAGADYGVYCRVGVVEWVVV